MLYIIVHLLYRLELSLYHTHPSSYIELIAIIENWSETVEGEDGNKKNASTFLQSILAKSTHCQNVTKKHSNFDMHVAASLVTKCAVKIHQLRNKQAWRKVPALTHANNDKATKKLVYGTKFLRDKKFRSMVMLCIGTKISPTARVAQWVELSNEHAMP